MDKKFIYIVILGMANGAVAGFLGLHVNMWQFWVFIVYTGFLVHL